MRRMGLLLIAPIVALMLVSAVIAQQPDSTETPVPPSATPPPTIDFGLSLPTPQPRATQGRPTIGSLLPITLSGVTASPLERNVAIRQGPGLDYPRIGVLRAGKSIDVTGTNGYDQSRDCLGVEFKTTLDMWLQVQFNEQRGWIARCTVNVVGDTSKLLVQPPP